MWFRSKNLFLNPGWNYESLRVVPSLKARTPAKITIKNEIPARSGEFMLRPEEKSTLDKSKVLCTPIRKFMISYLLISIMLTQDWNDLLIFECQASTLMWFCNNSR